MAMYIKTISCIENLDAYRNKDEVIHWEYWSIFFQCIRGQVRLGNPTGGNRPRIFRKWQRERRLSFHFQIHILSMNSRSTPLWEIQRGEIDPAYIPKMTTRASIKLSFPNPYSFHESEVNSAWANLVGTIDPVDSKIGNESIDQYFTSKA